MSETTTLNPETAAEALVAGLLLQDLNILVNRQKIATSSLTSKPGFVQSLPSDFSDVQPRTYDPNYISNISNQMQIPDRLQVDGSTEARPKSPVRHQEMLTNMTIPDRLVFVGEDRHVGLKSSMRQFDFDDIPQPEMSYVGMLTPPRTLTLEEQFPILEDTTEPEHKQPTMTVLKNGVSAPVYTPGTSPSDTLLLNEEDEATLLRTHLAKLTRRVVISLIVPTIRELGSFFSLSPSKIHCNHFSYRND
ncbi:MFF [Acanthosepion pharaonis]|uniref:Mitochondrial fission factor n=1 Tax=Acanthosepion pharaonis TaxID=158019 RepID=A0A812B9Q4_ACAPH|nr:MFF [Sepia pharaonis]